MSALFAIQQFSTGDQEVAGSTPPSRQHSFVEIGYEKNFYGHYLTSTDFKKGSCQFLAKECAQYWLTA